MKKNNLQALALLLGFGLSCNQPTPAPKVWAEHTVALPSRLIIEEIGEGGAKVQINGVPYTVCRVPDTFYLQAGDKIKILSPNPTKSRLK